jgi:hypothetical protein
MAGRNMSDNSLDYLERYSPAAKINVASPNGDSWFRDSIFAKEGIRKPKKAQRYNIFGTSLSGEGIRVFNRLQPFVMSDVSEKEPKKFGGLLNNALPAIPTKNSRTNLTRNSHNNLNLSNKSNE